MEHFCACCLCRWWLFKRTFANEFVKRFLGRTLSKVFDRLAMTCTNCQIHSNPHGIPPKIAISKLVQGNIPPNWRNVWQTLPKSWKKKTKQNVLSTNPLAPTPQKNRKTKISISPSFCAELTEFATLVKQCSQNSIPQPFPNREGFLRLAGVLWELREWPFPSESVFPEIVREKLKGNN